MPSSRFRPPRPRRTCLVIALASILGASSAAVTASPDNRAWTTGYVPIGEDTSDVVKPNRPFTTGGAGWSAFAVAARYGRLEIDDAVFPLFADPTQAAASARVWGLGLNRDLTTNLELVASCTRTRFDGDADTGDREQEQTLFTRAQFS